MKSTVKRYAIYDVFFISRGISLVNSKSSMYITCRFRSYIGFSRCFQSSGYLCKNKSKINH